MTTKTTAFTDCRFCGSEISAHDQFCGSCGKNNIPIIRQCHRTSKRTGSSWNIGPTPMMERSRAATGVKDLNSLA